MPQRLPYAEIKFDRKNFLQLVLSNKINSDINYALKVDLQYTYFAKKVQLNFPIWPH